MKRVLTFLLIAVLLALPVLTAQADGVRYVTGDELLPADAQERLDTRAAEIYEAHGVALYFFYDSSISDLVSYTKQFCSDVPETEALVLGFNREYYYFSSKGDTATAAFPEAVCDELRGKLVGSDSNEDKVLAYLNAAEQVLAAYDGKEPQPTETPASTNEPFAVPDYIALTAGGKPALVDEYGLLTEEQATELSQELVEIGNTYQCDVVIVTVPALGSKSAMEFADDYFDYNGYGYGAVPDATGMTVNGDGILLLISMEDRDFWISTSGYAITAFTDYGLQTYLEESFLPYLSRNNYYDGFRAYANSCAELLKMARDGMPYDCLHVYVNENALTVGQVQEFNLYAEQILDEQSAGVYFVQTENSDLDAFVRSFMRDRVSETNAIVFGLNASGHTMLVKGDTMRGKFTEKELAKLEETLLPYLSANDLSGTIGTYLERSKAILEKRPINWFTFGFAVLVGALLGRIPVSAMKRQLTDVSKQKNADSYLEPQSFVVRQNSDVLLGTSTTKSVHVVQSSSGSGRGGGGGGFHGGSSTHTSSSGGTHGGHGGKF